MKVAARTDIPGAQHTVGIQRAELSTGFSKSQSVLKVLQVKWPLLGTREGVGTTHCSEAQVWHSMGEPQVSAVPGSLEGRQLP